MSIKDYKLVIDLEMCDKVKSQYKKQVGNLHEIIQIGAVLLDKENKQVKKFSTYVKPEYSIIRVKITDLTGITQTDVEDAPDIGQALQSLIDEVIDLDNTTLCTWSDSDTKAIKKELFIKDIQNKDIDRLCDTYFDIQKDLNDKVKITNRINLTRALELIGLDFEGKAHGALADAINTAKLFTAMQDDTHVQQIINNIEELMTEKPCTSTLGSMIDFSQFNIET